MQDISSHKTAVQSSSHYQDRSIIYMKCDWEIICTISSNYFSCIYATDPQQIEPIQFGTYKPLHA